MKWHFNCSLINRNTGTLGLPPATPSCLLSSSFTSRAPQRLTTIPIQSCILGPCQPFGPGLASHYSPHLEMILCPLGTCVNTALLETECEILWSRATSSDPNSPLHRQDDVQPPPAMVPDHSGGSVDSLLTFSIGDRQAEPECLRSRCMNALKEKKIPIPHFFYCMMFYKIFPF